MVSKKNAYTDDVKDTESVEKVEPAQPVEKKPEPKATAKTANKTAVEKPVSVSYIGPSLPGGKLFQYTVFKNGVPVYAKKLIDECAALKFLFVPVSRLAVARQKLGDKTSVENAKFAEAKRHFAKGAN